MDYRRKKQIIILAIYFLIFVLLGFLAYLIWRPQPSCFDGIKNQNEEGIDCGGLCVSCEAKTLKAVEILQKAVIPVTGNFYDLIGEINNPNFNYGLADFSYEFQLIDANGNIISSQKGKNFILPGETKYIIEARVSAERPIAKANLILQGGNWIKLKEFDPTLIFIKNKELQQSVGGAFLQISGTAENKSPFDFDRAYINVVLLNSQKNIIGVNKTEIRSLLSGEDRYFVVKWFSEIPDKVEEVGIYPETNIFLDENFIRRYGEAEKFKEF